MNTGLLPGWRISSPLPKRLGASLTVLEDINPGTPSLELSFTGAGHANDAVYSGAPTPAPETGRLKFQDMGTAVGEASLVPGDATVDFTIARIDGGGYIYKNATFNHDTQAWTQQFTGGLSYLVEQSQGTYAIYGVPALGGTGQIYPAPGPGWTTLLGLEWTGGLTGTPVVFLQRTKIGDFTNKATVNAILESIAPSGGVSSRSGWFQGRTATHFLLAREAANSASLFDVLDGNDPNNSAYLLFGIDPTGSTVGCSQGGSFMSTAANGTGTARDLVLHQWAPHDVVLFTNNVERLRLYGVNTGSQGVGVLRVANATTAPTANPTGAGLLYANAGAGTWRGSSGTTTTFGPAEPHCPDCGRDFACAWENPKYGRLEVCMWCVIEQLVEGGLTRGIIHQEAA